jgi:hypothetical protein
LFNASGAQIYEGTFRAGQLLYSDFIGKTTAEIANMYTGLRNVFTYNDDSCVEMSEINAVDSISGGQNSLEAEWIVSNIIVLEDSISLGNEDISEINALTEFFGVPEYYGELWIDLSEAVAINLIKNPAIIGTVDMDMTAVFDNLFEVSSYDRDFSVYIFSY